MSGKEEKGHSHNRAPNLRKGDTMSDSNDSEIEEVGRKMASVAARHHRIEVGAKTGSGGPEDHSRILAPSFNWGPTSNFTSTLDIDAIKVELTKYRTSGHDSLDCFYLIKHSGDPCSSSAC